MSVPWNQALIAQTHLALFTQLEQLFGLSGLTDWPNAKGLESLKQQCPVDLRLLPQFFCQNELLETSQYYEEIIFKQNKVPTRPNSWHDLFNALVWLQYPRTKNLLNRLHIEDIEQHGLSPRTTRRDHLTHFDECGIVLAYCSNSVGPDIAKLLAEHHWHKAFVEHRHDWGHSIHAFTFGHANYELMLAPFTGLTGKYICIEVKPDFNQLSPWDKADALDRLMHLKLEAEQTFSQVKPLKPIPLLGIPHWWPDNQEAGYYQNTAYFRPKRPESKKIKQ